MNMIYPDNAAEKLGFIELKELIKAKCLSESGKSLVDRVQPQGKLDLINRFLRQTKEPKDLIEQDAPLPIDHFYPIKAIVDKIRIEGSFFP